MNTLWPANIIFDIGGVLFNSVYNHQPGTHITKELFTPIQEGIDLLNACYALTNKDGGRLHKFYILSNWRTDLFEQLTTAYPDLFNRFDGIVISGALPYKKPDKRIYEHLLQKYSLHPATCIFIDDSPENINAAQMLGITSLECINHKSIKQQLITLGLLP